MLQHPERHDDGSAVRGGSLGAAKDGSAAIELDGSGCTADDIYAIAVRNVRVTLSPTQLERVDACYSRVQQWGAQRHPIYGVNTGFGELINTIIPPKYKADLQRNLVRSHASGGGPEFPETVVRAIMATRLNCLLKGHSGVSRHALELLAAFVNAGVHPVVPQQGSLGASGDLAPLSHVALAVLGEGTVRVNGELMATATALNQLGLKPVEPGFKEALALVNGTSAMTGAACIALVEARRLLKLAVLATADVLQCLGGSTRPFDERGHVLKNHSGQVTVARELRRQLDASTLTRTHEQLMELISSQVGDKDEVVQTDVYLQSAYSMRCIPQILGPVVDTLGFCESLVEQELNAANDNPLFFDDPQSTFHGGNFHGQYVAMACDYLNIALVEVGVLAERQLDRLLSPHLNGSLPQFLAHGDSGLFCGFEGGQYLATSLASENLDLAAPASVKSIPSNGSNQDVVSMGLIAARKSLRLCEHVNTMLSVLFAACAQAAHFIGRERFTPSIAALHDAITPMRQVYRDDRPLADVVAQTGEVLRGAWMRVHVDEQVNLSRGANP